MYKRKASYERVTAETSIKLSLTIDGTGQSSINVGIPFIEHMLSLWARHGFFDLEVEGSGDREVDLHHLVEDLGLCLGEALKKALGSKEGIRRYGSCTMPMDETLVLVAVDLSGRPYLGYDDAVPAGTIGEFDLELVEEFLRGVVNTAGFNLHIRLLAGRNKHHIIEAIFKAWGRALDEATSGDERLRGVLSTKGKL